MKWIFTKIRTFITGEKAKLANATPQQKWEYFLDYYKWHAIAVLFLIVSIIYTVIAVNGQKEPALSGYFLDSFQEVYSEEKDRILFSDFCDKAGIDTDATPLNLYANMTMGDNPAENASEVIQKLMLDIAMGQVDFVTASQQTLTDLSYRKTPYFQDLREYLTEAQLEQYADRLFYIDETIRPTSTQSFSENQGELLLPSNPNDPESMLDPIPIAIDVRSNEEIDGLYPLNEDPVYLGFVINAPHAQLLPLFLEYLLS